MASVWGLGGLFGSDRTREVAYGPHRRLTCGKISMVVAACLRSIKCKNWVISSASTPTPGRGAMAKRGARQPVLDIWACENICLRGMAKRLSANLDRFILKNKRSEVYTRYPNYGRVMAARRPQDNQKEAATCVTPPYLLVRSSESCPDGAVGLPCT